MRYFIFISIYFVLIPQSISQKLGAKDIYIGFISNAPLEIIEAESNECRGVLDMQNRNFSFSVDISSFYGFNIELQRTHFQENYMEYDKFPNATFKGKILDEINSGTSVNIKGVFTIHGVSKERILSAKITQEESQIRFDCKFKVPLKDHNIKLPRIVLQKIAKEINVHVTGNLIQLASS